MAAFVASCDSGDVAPFNGCFSKADAEAALKARSEGEGMEWIFEFNALGDYDKFIVCSINQERPQGGKESFYLAGPTIAFGWQVKRLMPRCYAALPIPEFVMPERPPCSAS